MIDGFGRTIDYLRISVTDKCNLRCKYCMPEGGIELMPHEELLSLEELYRVVRIMEGLGIKKVRFTGGEPLVRKNLIKLIEDVGRLPGIEEIAMTTNGVLFGDKALELKNAGLTGVNISLDTLDKEHFRVITGADAVDDVLNAIKKAQEADIKVKINCVPCMELNEADIVELAAIAMENDVDVRYIELMPLGCGKDFHGLPSDEILAKLEVAYGQGTPTEIQCGNGPAQYYKFENFKGRIGFISPMSHKFCSECNRVRLTAEGRLKLCLHYDTGIELKPLLRGGCSDEEIRTAILESLKKKPKAHHFEQELTPCEVEHSDNRRMVQIGG